jgi:hypothetical protein
MFCVCVCWGGMVVQKEMNIPGTYIHQVKTNTDNKSGYLVITAGFF